MFVCQAIAIFFLPLSIFANTVIFLPPTLEKKEIEQTFANVGWDTSKFKFCSIAEDCDSLMPDKEMVYELKISEQSEETRIIMKKNGEKQVLYETRVPSSLKKTALENFEKFLSRHLFQHQLLLLPKRDIISKSPTLFLNNQKLKIGDPIEIGFETFESGYVYVFLISSSGNDPILLFPNNTQKSSYVPNPGKTWISSNEDQIRASKPLGKETIRLVQLSEEWRDFDLKPIPNSKFNFLLPKKELNKKSTDKNKALVSDFEDKIKATSEISWEIIAR